MLVRPTSFVRRKLSRYPAAVVLALCSWVTCASLAFAAETNSDGYIVLFDGKSLAGWKASESADSWRVEDGNIVGSGAVSHLFYMEREFKDVEFKADIKLAAGSNSGMYFRAAFTPGWPKGYEAQVNNSHRDPKRTGSLYNFVNVTEQLIADDTWWTQTITARGNHIVIRVNDQVVVDYTDEKNTYTSGYLALQQHDPKSVVRYKNLLAKPLD